MESGADVPIRGRRHPSACSIRGFEFYDGRVGAEQVVFARFQPNVERPASGIGFNRNNAFNVNALNFARDIDFLDANPVYLETPNPEKDGDKNAVILDEDGSLTGTAGSYVAADYSLLVTPACTRRTEWNAWSCPHRYAHLQIQGHDGEAVAPLDVRRDDGVSGSLVGLPDRPQSASLSVIPGREYVLTFRNGIPLRPRLHLRDIREGDEVMVSLPYSGGSFAVTRDYNTKNPLPAAASRAELEASAGELYFFGNGLRPQPRIAPPQAEPRPARAAPGPITPAARRRSVRRERNGQIRAGSAIVRSFR